jgi:hypothetical protein
MDNVGISDRSKELYDEHRRKVWEDVKSGTENFDRYMLTLSAGALGLSLAFIKDIVPLGMAIWIPSLVASWIAFILCILITLVSFRISILALEKMVPHLDEYYLKGNPAAFNRHMKSLWTKASDWCAYAALICFVSGLVFTMMFVGFNIGEVKRMSKQETATKVMQSSEQKGIKPVTMTPLMPANVSTDTLGIKPVAMTPITPAQISNPNASVAPAQPAQTGQSVKK